MTKPTQAQIEAAKVLHQLKWLYSADGDERDPKALEIIAAAITEVGQRNAAADRIEQIAFDKLIAERDAIKAAAIERCAQVAEWEGYATVGRQIAAAIRALKDS